MWCLANGVLKFIAAFAINIVSWVQRGPPDRDADINSEREIETERKRWGEREAELGALAAAFCMIAACNASHTNCPQCCA